MSAFSEAGKELVKDVVVAQGSSALETLRDTWTKAEKKEEEKIEQRKKEKVEERYTVDKIVSEPDELDHVFHMIRPRPKEEKK